MHSTAFVSGPYTAIPHLQSTIDNIAIATDCAIWLWTHDYYVFCPHLNSRHFDTFANVPESRYIDFYLSILRSGIIDLLVLLPHWELSSGTEKEFKLARLLQIPICTWTPDTDQLIRVP